MLAGITGDSDCSVVMLPAQIQLEREFLTIKVGIEFLGHTEEPLPGCHWVRRRGAPLIVP